MNSHNRKSVFMNVFDSVYFCVLLFHFSSCCRHQEMTLISLLVLLQIRDCTVYAAATDTIKMLEERIDSLNKMNKLLEDFLEEREKCKSD